MRGEALVTQLEAVLPPAWTVSVSGRKKLPPMESASAGRSASASPPEELAVIGTYDEIIPKVKERYAGVVTTLDFGFGYRTAEEHERPGHLVQELRKL